MKLKPQFRNFEVKGFDKEEKTVELSFSSEDPYERYWGVEILDHSAGSVNMERLNNAAPLLFNHDRDVVIGVVEFAKIENNRGVALVRFGNSAKAKEVFSDVVDGIMKNVSVGYQIDEMKLESEKDGLETYRVTQWQPFEISIVSIPADNTVGVGRGLEDDNLPQHEVKILNLKKEEKNTMTPEEKKALEEAARSAATKAEQVRCREILAMGSKHNLAADAQKAMEDGTSTDDFRAIVLEKLAVATPVDTKAADSNMKKEDVKAYSFARAMAAAITGNWDLAPLEKAASDKIAKMSGKDSRGFYLPHEVMKREITTTDGAAIIDTTNGGASFIDILRNKLLLAKLGGTVLTGLSGNVAIPKQTGKSTAYWINEGGETTASELGLGLVKLEPKTVSGKTGYTRQMLLQGNPAIEQLVLNDLATVLALEIDRAGFAGTGIDGQPKGILNTTGINAIDCSAGLSHAAVVDFETQVAEGNADVENMHYAAGAKVTGKLKTTSISSANPRMLLEAGEVNGYKHTRSNQIPANTMVFGDFSQVITGLWGGLDIMVDPYEKADEGGVVIRAFQTVDIGVKYAESFSASTDIPN